MEVAHSSVTTKQGPWEQLFDLISCLLRITPGQLACRPGGRGNPPGDSQRNFGEALLAAVLGKFYRMSQRATWLWS